MSIANLSTAPAQRQSNTLSRLAARLSAGILLMTVIAVPALAQPTVAKAPVVNAEKKAVAIVLTQFKVVKAADGTEQLKDATSIKPGEIIEYKAVYTNNTGKAVTGLIANLPIPEGLEYIPKSAKPGATLVKAATKDGQYAAEPLMRKLPDNKVEPVPYNEYRALRWTLGQLPAGGEIAVTARAKVEIAVPPAHKTAPGSPQSPPVTVTPKASAAR